MEGHIANIKKLCRLCKETIKLNASYVNPKSVNDFQVVIQEHYNLSVDTECNDIFPKFLCSSCTRKLRHLKNKPATKITTAAYYGEHSDHCEICKSITIKSNVSIKDVDKLFSDCGFVKCNEVKSFKRIYIKHKLQMENSITNEFSFFVNPDDTWFCLVLGHSISNTAISAAPKLTMDCLADFKIFFEMHKSCPGLTGYSDVISQKIDIKLPSTNFLVETETHNLLGNKENYKIWRHNTCNFFILKSSVSCQNCKSLIPTLRKSRSRQSSDGTTDSSSVNYRFLSREELIERLGNVQKKKKEVIQKLATLNSKVQEDIGKSGLVLQEEEHNSFKKVLVENDDFEFEEETPQWLLWQQQKLQASKSNSKGMRWHPLIIRWCLSIYYTSSAAYKQMSNKQLNFLTLPSIDTLRNYTHFTKAQTGFNPDIIKRLSVDANAESLDEKQRQVVISFDEMKIKSKLVYSKSDGRLVGFTELGTLNEEFKAYQASFNNESISNQDFATHVNVFLVRGIFSSLIYPFGYFATSGITASQLYSCAMEAVGVLGSIGLETRAFVSDGASVNRKFFKLAANSKEDFNWTWNPHNPTKKIYFFSDVPHLLKTTRNCFENSKWNNNTRNMHIDSQDITWRHIVNVYEEDLGVQSRKKDVIVKTSAPGLRRLHKITEEHVKLTSRSRMTVKLAAQVLSKTMQNALIAQGKHNTKSTSDFVGMFDKVFDCLNVSNFNKGRNGKKELDPYTSPDDWRFKFLIEDFLEGYLVRWEKQVEESQNLTTEEKNKMMLSVQTRHGWKMTVKSFVSLTKELLVIDGVKFLFSDKFNQDPLEEHFGRQRRRGGSSDNPTLAEYGQQELALNVMRSELMQDIRGNARGRDRDGKRKIEIQNAEKLPKRKVKRNSKDA